MTSDLEQQPAPARPDSGARFGIILSAVIVAAVVGGTALYGYLRDDRGDSGAPPVDQSDSYANVAAEACQKFFRETLPAEPTPQFIVIDVIGQGLHFHVNGSVVTADPPYTPQSRLLTKYWACDMTGTAGGASWHVDDWTLR